VEIVPAGGGPGEKRWLFARMPEFDHAAGGERPGPRLTYRYVPAETPAQVEIEIRRGAEVGKHRFAAQDGEPLQLPDGRSVLVYELKNDVKDYRSRLAVLEGDRKVLEKTIEVNDPLSYGGYVFYQSNYRKEDPTYSGIQVVRDPGLSMVWAGFLMLCAGVIVIYYARPRRPAAGSGEVA
jgi:cytochrome c biogenesis protein ResB